METAVDDHCHDEFTGNDLVINLATAMSVNDLDKKLQNLVQKILSFHQCSSFDYNFGNAEQMQQTER